MVYPILKLNQNDYEIEFIDTECNENDLIIQFDNQSTVEIFYDFLNMFINQYNNGYTKGYNDALDEDINIEGDFLY